MAVDRRYSESLYYNPFCNKVANVIINTKRMKWAMSNGNYTLFCNKVANVVINTKRKLHTVL